MKPEYVKFAVWAVAFVGTVVLIALGKVPPSALQYLLMWVAGAMGGKAVDGLNQPKDPPQEDQK